MLLTDRAKGGLMDKSNTMNTSELVVEKVEDDPSEAARRAVDTLDDVEPTEEFVWSRFGDGPLPSLPKAAAIHRAFKAATEFGLPETFASALANSVVDPPALRIALNNPTKINVSGGTIEVIDIDMFTPGLVPLPTNTRTMDVRVYPAGGATGHLGPLIGPRSEQGISHGLWIQADSVEHALEQAKRAYDYVLVKNPLKDSVAARGIVMPVTVVYFEMRHRDNQPAMPLLGTADGSSRVTGAHAALGLNDPKTTCYDFPTNRDSFRRFVNGIVSSHPASLGATAARKLRAQRNALITPTRVFLRFTPQPGGAHGFGRAVAAYVGMLHVDPPRPWTPTGKLEAMAEAVLEVLRSAAVLDDVHHDYLAGLLTPQAAEEAGLPTEPDAQAAYVLASLLRSDRRKLVDQGIMEVTAKRSVSAPRRHDVIAELALRPTRSAANTLMPGAVGRERAAAMRAAYLRATHLPEYASRRWDVTGREPDEIFECARAELRRPDAEQANPEAWRHRLELAALAQYHMTAYEALKRDAMGNKGGDTRGPHELLKLMLEDERGLLLMRQAIIDGRAGNPPRIVDISGTLVHSTLGDKGGIQEGSNGTAVAVTDHWLRIEGFPSGGPINRPVALPTDTPSMRATKLQDAVRNTIDHIAKLMEDLDDVEAASGGRLMDQRGWPLTETSDIVKSLTLVQSKLGYWGVVADKQAAQIDEDAEGDDEDPEDDSHTEEASRGWDDES
ncbi:hypothetical protein [Nocardia sp. NPDC057272]|uniref:hypothetical protein n=1 Tax=Nocardia sp. NPDC057272 TaxID=3346079 RepID=UPI0036452B52